MKKYIVVIFLLLSISVKSQILISLLLGDKLNTGNIEFGLDAGYNWASISGMETNKGLGSFNLGFYFDIRIKNQWFLDTGVLVKSTQGVNKLTTNDLDFLQVDIFDEEGTYSQNISSFIIPALIKYKFKNHMYVEAGPQFALMYKSWVEFNSRSDEVKSTIRQYNKDAINKIDAGISVGMGYRLLKGTGWTLGANYYYGFVNVYKDRSGTKNSGFFINMNFPIGVGEKQKLEKQEQKDLKAEKKKRKKEARKKAKEEKNQQKNSTKDYRL